MPDISPDDRTLDLGPLPESEESNSALIPAEDVKPEDVATLTLKYQKDGSPLLVATGGRCIPAALPITDDEGNHLSHYAAAGATAKTPMNQQTAYLDLSAVYGLPESGPEGK